MTTEDTTHREPPAIQATGNYDPERNVAVITATLDDATLTAVYTPSDNGSQTLDFLYSMFPGVVQSVVDAMEDKALEGQADYDDDEDGHYPDYLVAEDIEDDA